jgi:hypothetical protein
MYNGLSIPIWQQLLQTTSTASCCARPAESPVPQIIAAVCFYGFGYLTLQMDADFSVVTSNEMTIQFRTYAPNAVIFLVDKAGTEAYYGLYIVNGQAVLVISSGGYGSDVLLSSGRIYNDGKWYQVSATLCSIIIFCYSSLRKTPNPNHCVFCSTGNNFEQRYVCLDVFEVCGPNGQHASGRAVNLRGALQPHWTLRSHSDLRRTKPRQRSHVR